jgi:hypothetical protein
MILFLQVYCAWEYADICRTTTRVLGAVRYLIQVYEAVRNDQCFGIGNQAGDPQWST